jgi:hypothetical protein
VTLPWQPILDQELSRAARAAARDIATELAVATPRAPGLAAGDAGLALFFSYYGDVTGEEWAYDHATRLLEHSGASIHAQLGVTWSSGIAGIGWTLEYLAGDPSDDDDPNAGIDAVFLELLS